VVSYGAGNTVNSHTILDITFRCSVILSILFSWCNSPLVGQGLLIIEASRSHSAGHTALGRTHLDEWSAQCRYLLPDNTQHSRQTDIRDPPPGGLRRGSSAVRLLGLWVRISLGAWMPVSCECCLLSGRGLCVELITRRYRVWCVWVWLRSPDNEEALASLRLLGHGKYNDNHG
jgi:hypothetical protein